MTNQLEFLFSSLKSISRDTALLEMFDWNEENLEKFNEEVARALTLYEMSNPQALVDFLVETATPYTVEFLQDNLESMMQNLVEQSIAELNNLQDAQDN